MKWLAGGLATIGLLLVARSASAKARASPLDGRPGRFWTWAELTVSPTAKRLGLDNTPGPEARANLRWLCTHLLDPLRSRFGRQVQVTSAYRSPEVNRAVGGVPSSRHMRGRAVDIVLPEGVAAPIAEELRRVGFRVMAYPGHLHVEAPGG